MKQIYTLTVTNPGNKKAEPLRLNFSDFDAYVDAHFMARNAGYTDDFSGAVNAISLFETAAEAMSALYAFTVGRSHD